MSKNGTPSVQSEADDASAGIHQDVHSAVRVGIELAPLLCVGGAHFAGPAAMRVVPAQFERIDEDRAQGAALAVEIELQLAIAAGGIAEGVDSSINGLV